MIERYDVVSRKRCNTERLFRIGHRLSNRSRPAEDCTDLCAACRIMGAIETVLAAMMASKRQRSGTAAVLAILVSLAHQPALADAICVTCDGPPRVYSCSYAPNANGDAPNKGQRALQFACIQDVARQYQHASCSVKRNQLGACNGVVHMMSQGPVVAPTATADQVGATVPTPVPPAAAKVTQSSEPKTVVEMAKRTASDTQKQIDKSARSVSKAARSTWRCVSTLFQKC